MYTDGTDFSKYTRHYIYRKLPIDNVLEKRESVINRFPSQGGKTSPLNFITVWLLCTSVQVRIPPSPRRAVIHVDDDADVRGFSWVNMGSPPTVLQLLHVGTGNSVDYT